MKIIPTRDANASSVNLVKYLNNENVNFCQNFNFNRPDYSWSIHSNNYNAEKWWPKSNPKSRCQVVEAIAVAEIHQNSFKDEDRSSAAQHCQRLPGEQTEYSSSQEMTQERFKNTLKTIRDISKKSTKSNSFCDGRYNNFCYVKPSKLGLKARKYFSWYFFFYIPR